jgi:RNA-directed DNA polymerase
VRHIHKATVRDRISHHAIFRVLNPIFEPTFIPTSFSCRFGKDTHKGVDALARMLRVESCNNTRIYYVLKCDVQKFFDSVDHAILLSILEKRVVDPEAMWLLREIIGSYNSKPQNLMGGVESRVFLSATLPRNSLRMFT